MVKVRAKGKAEGNEMKRGREKNYIRCFHGTKSTSNKIQAWKIPTKFNVNCNKIQQTGSFPNLQR